MTSPRASWWVWSALLLALLAGLLMPGCRKRDPYSQASPEDVLASAIAMVKNGEAGKLTRLIYADTREYRSVLNRLSGLLDSLQSLGVEVKNRFPKDVEALRAQMVEKVKGADQSGLAAKLNTESAPPAASTPARMTGSEARRREQQFEDLSRQILADPFSLIEANADRLSVERLADDAATIKFDNEPLLMGAIQLKKHADQWYIELPLNLPFVSSFVPQTRNEWSIIGSLIKMTDAVVQELEADLKAGAVPRLELLANKAGEKAFMPGAMIVLVYGKEMDIRRQRERAVRAFRKRANTWAEARMQAGADPDSTRAIVAELAKVGVERLDALVRRRAADPKVQIPKWEDLDDPALVALMNQWLQSVTDRGDVEASLTRARAEEIKSAVARNLVITLRPATPLE